MQGVEGAEGCERRRTVGKSHTYYMFRRECRRNVEEPQFFCFVFTRRGWGWVVPCPGGGT